MWVLSRRPIVPAGPTTPRPRRMNRPCRRVTPSRPTLRPAAKLSTDHRKPWSATSESFGALSPSAIQNEPAAQVTSRLHYHPKPDVTLSEISFELVTPRATASIWRTQKRTAAINAKLGIATWTGRIALRTGLVVFRVVTILAPFADIAVHVEQAEAVQLEFTSGAGERITVRALQCG